MFDTRIVYVIKQIPTLLSARDTFELYDRSSRSDLKRWNCNIACQRHVVRKAQFVYERRAKARF